MKNQQHTITVGQVFFYWFLTILLGGVLVPLAGMALDPNDYSVATIAPSFLLFFFTGMIFSLPSLGALLILCRLLNNAGLHITDYQLRHNVFHLAIALVSFSAYGLMIREMILQIAIGFTTAGLIVWNTGIILSSRKK
jgi:hypothetical protein